VPLLRDKNRRYNAKADFAIAIPGLPAFLAVLPSMAEPMPNLY